MFLNLNDKRFDSAVLRVTAGDIKQFVYCPRIIYFKYVLPVPILPTYKMLVGRDVHRQMYKREKRRTINRYKLADGERIYHQFFQSDRLGLVGKLDLLIQQGANFYPVEYKNSYGEPDLHHRYQLTAYALLLEDAKNVIVRRGYIYMLEEEQVFSLEITESKKKYAKHLLHRMRSMIASETMPPPTTHRERCIECEFKLYCGDTV